jgi:hypothetical protein
MIGPLDLLAIGLASTEEAKQLQEHEQAASVTSA